MFTVRGLSIAGAIAGAVLFAAPTAFAGECPANQLHANVTKPMTMPKGVTDTVLAAVDLSKEKIGAKERQLRIRKLEIEPGGVVPFHSHGDRPALIYIVEGEIFEYSSLCAVPILHKAGDVAPETHLTSHWWQNTTDKKVVLLSADILHDASDKNM
jgi:quercetin dioxygenase-like cupin family protein